jgi:hypothetical protein
MDFDAFLKEASRKVKKKKFRKSKLTPKKQKEILESALLDDECEGVPQTDDGRKTYG